jgi:hypothetical protein
MNNQHCPCFAEPVTVDSFGRVFALGEVGDYSFSQQQKDFIKLQFKYALRLKQRLDEGSITQDYYDTNIGLTTQQLQSPYAGWISEFTTAIQEEDLQWLAKQVGEDVGDIAKYMGRAAGTAIGSVTSGIASGVVEGVKAGASSLSLPGWLLIGGVAVAAYFLFMNAPQVRAARKLL